MKLLSDKEAALVCGGDDAAAEQSGTCEWISGTAGGIAAGTMAVAMAVAGPETAIYIPAVSTFAGEYTEFMAGLQCEMYAWMYQEISESLSGL